MSVWLLLMVLLSPVPGIDSSTLLNKFNEATAEADCITERNRIAADMEASYPGDKSFAIKCELQTPKVNIVATTRSEYEEIIKNFGKSRYPNQLLTIVVLNIKELRDESGLIPITAVQINVIHKDGGESFFVLIQDKKVLGWIDAGEAPKEEEEEEVFQNKDQT